MGKHHRRRTAARTESRVAAETAPPRYQEWLRHVFYQPLDARGGSAASWLPPFSSDAAETVALVGVPLRNVAPSDK